MFRHFAMVQDARRRPRAFFRVADFRACGSFFAGTPPRPCMIDGPLAAKVDYTTDGSLAGESLSALAVRAVASGAGVKKTLQDEHGGYLVDHGTAIGRHATGGIQMTMSFGGGEPFIPQGDLHSGMELQRVGEVLRLERLRTNVTGHVQGVAHHYLGTAVSAYQPGQGAEVLAPVFAHQGEDGLRGEPQLVGDGNADAPIADVETQDATGWLVGFIHRSSIKSSAKSSPTAFADVTPTLCPAPFTVHFG